MFKAYDGDGVLGDMLRKAGILDYSQLELEQTWEVFKDFVKVPFITKSDGILVEWGTFRWAARDVFSFHFCRQLKEPGEDKYVQIDCAFEYEPTEILRSYGRDHKWWFTNEPEQTQAAFLAHIETLEPFRELLKNQTPTKTSMFLTGT